MNKKSKANYLKVTTATALVAAVVVAAPIAPQASTFDDVQSSHQFYEAIKSLSDRGIINGYPDGSFQPEKNITRGQAAKILAGVLGLDTTNVINPNFKDIPKTHQYYGAIAALKQKGIIDGYPDGTFRQDSTIQRNHVAKILANALNIKATAVDSLPFTDINTEYKEAIAALYENKITTGKTATKFDGSSNVTRGQMAAFITRAETVSKTTPESTESVSFKVENYTTAEVIINGKAYSYSDSVKSIFTEANKEALDGASIVVSVSNGVITNVNSLTLNNAGTADREVTFSANAVIDVLTINADYVAVSGLKVTGNAVVTINVNNSVELEGVTVYGEIIVDNAIVAKLASLDNKFANDGGKGPRLMLKNSNAGNIHVKRNGTAIESDTVITEITIATTVTLINVDGTVTNVTVESTAKLELTGDANIGQLLLTTAVDLALHIKGIVETLAVSNPNAKVLLGTDVSLNVLSIPSGTTAASIISNYAQLVSQIANIIIDSSLSPTVPPINTSDDNISEEKAVEITSLDLGVTVADALGANNNGKGTITTQKLPAGATGYKYQVNTTKPTILAGQSTATGWTSLAASSTTAPIELTNGQIITVATVDASGNIMAIQNITVSGIVDFIAGIDAVKIAAKGIGIDQKVFNGFYDKFFLNGIKIDLVNLKKSNSSVEAVAQALQADIAAIFTGKATSTNGNSNQTFRVTVGTGNHLGKLIITAPSTGDKPEVGLGGSDGYLLQFLGLTANTIVGKSDSEKSATVPVTPAAIKAPGTTGGTIKLTGLTSGLTYEYLIDSNATLAGDAPTWSEATSVTLSGTEIDNLAVDAGQYVHLRVKATSTNFVSNVQNLLVGLGDIQPAAAPDVMSIAAETLVGGTRITNLVEGVVYKYFLSNSPTTDSGDGAWATTPHRFEATSTTTADFATGSARYIHIRIEATSKQPTSAIKSIAVVEKTAPIVQAIPTGIGVDLAAGLITGTKATQEYSLNGGTDWNDASETNTSVTFESGNSVVVREKATANALASAPTAPIHVEAPALAPTANKASGENSGTIKLTGLTSGLTYEYVIDSNATLAGDAPTWSEATSVTLSGTEIDNIAVDAGQYVHLRVKATSMNFASNVQNLLVGLGDIQPAAAPNVMSIAAETLVGGTRITNLVEGVIYKYFLSNSPTTDSGDGAWATTPHRFEATSTTTADFATGSARYIHIRIEATSKQPTSAIKSIAVVEKSAPVPAAKPAASIAQGTDDGTIKLTGLLSDVQYEYIVNSDSSLDGNTAAWSSVTGTEIDNIAVAENQYVHLRVKATTNALASEAQSIQVGADHIRSYVKDVAAEKVTLTLQATAIHYVEYSLPKPLHGTTIVWKAIGQSEVKQNGSKTAYGAVGTDTFTVSGDPTDTITFEATITKGNVTDTKQFTVTVN